MEREQLHTHHLPHLGAQGSSLLTFVLNDSRVSNSLTTIMEKLVCLKFDCTYDLDRHRLGTANDTANANFHLRKIFDRSQRLQTLSMSCDSHIALLDGMVLGIIWPFLSILDLGDQLLTTSQLISACQKHKDTLINLTLRNVRSEAQHEPKKWEDVAKELAKILRVQSINLMGLYDRAARRDLSLRRMQKLGLRIIG